jgi:hypothetical protein
MTMENKLLNSLLPHLGSNFKFNIKNPPLIGTQAVFYDHVVFFSFAKNRQGGKEKLFLALKYGREPNSWEDKVDLSKYDSIDIVKYSDEKKTKYKIVANIPLISNV